MGVDRIKMINQSKINSFISLIARAHSEKKQPKYLSAWTKSHFPTQQSTRQVFNPDSFNVDKHYSIDEFGVQSIRKQVDDSVNRKINLLISQASKEKKKKHSDLYSLYRQSIEKKKSSILSSGYHETNLSPDKLKHSNHSSPKKHSTLRTPKQLNFPINHPNKNSNGKFSSFKIMKKRQLTSPCTFLHCNQIESPKKMRTEAEQSSVFVQINLRQMVEGDRNKEAKTIFRVKKCALVYRQHETLDKLEDNEQRQKTSHQKIDASPSKPQSTSLQAIPPKRHSNTSKATYQNKRYSRPRQSSFKFDVEPWEYEQKQQHELVYDI